MELSWTPSALGDLDVAGNFIAEDNPRAAQEMARRVAEAVEYLMAYPSLGRIGRLHGTRELVVSGTPFVIVYRVRHDEIQVLRMLHHAQKWPR